VFLAFWPFPPLAVLPGVAPKTAILFFYSGGDVRSLASAQAALFYSMFGTTEFVIGFGYVLVMPVPD
jgi:hypothetical protein